MGLLQGQRSAHTVPTADAAPEPRVAVTARGVLVERAQAGDRDAFEALLERWLDPSLQVAFVILGNEADARDATQEAFLQAWRDIPRLRDP
ncbi:MAG: polymerase subunit sigma-70, partial [Chloroflexi bacterium]|nr:polymerase subunit sigma-70 [Chloroflexota bacterium]